MSITKRPPYVPRPSSSGEHKAVKAMRAKFISLAQHTIPLTKALSERVEELSNKISSHPPTASEADLEPDTLPEGVAAPTPDDEPKEGDPR